MKLALVAVLGCGQAACAGPRAFECRADAECRVDAALGICQNDGWCSFADDTCPSGQRYGEHAGDGKAAECVPLDDAATDTGSAPETTGMTTTTSAATTATMTTAATSSTITTMASSDDDGTASQGPGSSESGEPPLPCVLEDELEGAMLDGNAWEWWEDGATLVYGGGLLTVVVPEATVAMAGIRSQGWDLHGHSVEMVVASGPNPDTSVEQALIIHDDVADVRITLRGGDVLVSTYAGMYELLGGGPNDLAVFHRFRVGERDGVMFVERAGLDKDWETLWEGDPPLALDAATITARVLAWEPVTDPGSPAFDAFFVCPVP